MATRYFGTTSDHPKISSDFVGASSGGTLSGSQKVQVVWDDTSYPNTPEGKQRLVASLKFLRQRIQTARTWPIDSNS